jgi:hypothetical protein
LTNWLPTTKIQESPQFPHMQVAYNISLEDLNKGYNFALDLISIGGLHTKLWAPKLGFPSHLGVPWQNAIWM